MTTSALAPHHRPSHVSSLPSLAHWRPTTDLLVVGVSWAGVVAALSAATFLATAQRGGLYFILYALVGAAVIGVGVPLAWTVLVRRRSLADLGLTWRHWRLSLLLQAALGAAQYAMTLRTASLPSLADVAPLLALVLAIGFFEAVFWRGWVFLRLEEAFGLLPALAIGPALYALYHVGYGMAADEMAFLFVVGLAYAAIFRITGSVLVLWPVLQPMGQLYSLLGDLAPLPPIAALGFGEVLIAMLVMVWLARRISRGQPKTPRPQVPAIS
jgi:uncharacterized protein